MWKRIADWVWATRARIAVLRYVVALLVTLSTSFLMPVDALGDSRGVFAFLVIVGCAWYCGIGPGQVSLLLLIVSFKYRIRGIRECLEFSSSDLSTTAVLSVVIGLVGWAGEFRRRSQAIARRQAAELRDLHRRKDEFLATLAHELRNPLAPLRNGLEVLRLGGSGSATSADIAEIHVMMQRQLEHLVRLIDDLLDVGRINTGKIELRRELVQTADVVMDAIETARPNIAAAELELSTKIPDASIMIRVDRTRISQVLTNLLNNAAKFTPVGGRITVKVSADRHTVEITVADTGIGISSDMLPRVFEMFTQASNPLTRTHGGLGIGLSLARALTEMHGGSLVAYSAGFGKGSSFVLRLPQAVDADVDRTGAASPCIVPAQNGFSRQMAEQMSMREKSPHSDSVPVRVPDRGGLDARPRRKGGPLANAPTQITAGLRILIVDDNQDAAETLAVLLSARGHQCRTAADGKTALEAAIEMKPEVFVLDIGLPGMTGCELAELLRSMPPFQNAVLIAVTGWGKDEDRQRSKKAGFDHHLIKPADIEDVTAILARIPRHSPAPEIAREDSSMN